MKPTLRDHPIRLSYAQRRWWLLEQLTGSTVINHLPASWRLEGSLDRDALVAALRQVVARHETLRTAIIVDNDEPRQVVRDIAPVEIELIDLRGRPEAGRQQDLQALFRECEARPFNVASAPLFRTFLVQLAEDDHVFFLMPHHIIWDGWSWDILLHELDLLYRAQLEPGVPPLPPLPVQYGDFALWQEQLMRSAAFERQLAYWRETLAGSLPLLELPTDRPRPSLFDHHGACHEFWIGQQDVDALTQLGKSGRATLQMTLMACLTVLLSRYGRSGELTVGVPIQARSLPELEGLIGVFVNTLVLRLCVDPDMTFRKLLVHVRDVSLAGFDNQEVPFDRLVEALNPPRDLSRTPLYQVLFSYQDVRNRGNTLGGLKRTQVHVQSEVAPTDLTFGLMEYGTGVLCFILYRTSLFNADTIARMGSHLHNVVRAVVADPDVPVKRLPMLSHDEERQLVHEWNQTSALFPMELCIHQLFEMQATKSPQALAAVFRDQSVSYSELDRRANNTADRLRSSGARPGVLVGLFVERSLEMLVGLLAILKSGAAYVPMDPAFPAERLGWMIQDAAMPIIVTQSSLVPSLPAHHAKLVLLDIPSPQLPPPLSVSHSPRSNDLAYVIYTSGSTGRPKGVEIEHRSVVNFLKSMAKKPGLTSEDILLAVTTLSFDIAVLELFLPLAMGARVVIAPRDMVADGHELIREVERHEVTVLQATPATWRLLLAAGWEGNKRIKALCGGEALSVDLATDLIPRVHELWNMFGPTETTVWSTCCRVTDPENISIGSPIDNTDILVLNDALQPQPIGVPGELMIGGTGLARGYHHRPELTSAQFITHPFCPSRKLYRTGDLARWRTDGTIECLGRIDFQVKVRGFRIELGEIENRLVLHPDVDEAVVSAVGGNDGERRLVAYYVSSAALSPEASTLRRHLRQSLPDYMVPAQYVRLPIMPRTPNGKVNRAALPHPGLESTPTRNLIPPGNDTEKRLVSIFEEVLGVSSVSIDDNFFDLGGHSLSAVKLMNRIERTFGTRIPLALLFNSATVSALASRLMGAREVLNENWTTLVPIRPRSDRPVLCLVHGAGGNVLLYRELAGHLCRDLSVFGFQSQGLDGKARPLETIEELAIHYVEELLRRQPHGPYHLGGYCMGGAIAFEMARILRLRNKPVGLVALLDTYNLALVSRPAGKSKFSFIRQKVGFHLGTLRRIGIANLFGYVSEKLRMAEEAGKVRFVAAIKSFRSNAGGSEQALNDNSVIQDVNHQAAWNYVPKPYSGSITVFRPEKNYDFFVDPEMGWRGLVTGTLEVVQVPVNPHAMLVEPFVKTLAKEILKRVPSKTHDRARR